MFRPGLLALVAALVVAPPAGAAEAPPSWPPAGGPGFVIAHYGEEHWNDKDGRVLLTKVVEDVARHRPGLVTMSGDKANNGVPAELGPWLEIMGGYDRAGIPWFAGVGNHDRSQATGENALTDEVGGSTPIGDLGPYREFFEGRPYPMGDAAPYDRPGFGPAARPAGDPDGAASHYHVDVPGARVVFLDNSCYGIVNCEPLQAPPDAEGLTQYEYLAKHAADAKAQGRRVFVVMHMPTQDVGDQSYRKETAVSHTMGKGISPDNAQFERAAAAVGVDGVLLAHIKGQFEYRGEGGVPYFVDGGAGGELYTKGPVGTDHGYWHGYRLIRVAPDGSWRTDAVPILTPGSLRVEGPPALGVGDRVRYEGFGAQPVEHHTAKVDALELRDPDPAPRASGAALPGAVVWLAPPLIALVLAAGFVPRRGRALRAGAGLAAAGVLGAGSLAAAQQSVPTSTPKDALPNPARIWTSADARVLAPVASDSDDPRRDAATQTADGAFRARCPGRTKLWLTAGWERRALDVHVRSAPGRLVRGIRRARSIERGRRARLARVTLRQHAVLRARVKRRGRTVATLRNRCTAPGRRSVRWTPGRRGRYRLVVAVRSDREPVVRRSRLVVR